MPIPESTLSSWSHHHSGQASAQAHTAIRDALSAYDWPSGMTYDVFLQGSYKNETNLRRDSDVDLVIQLGSRIRPRLAALSGAELQGNDAHKLVLQRWQAFRRHALSAMKAGFGNSVTAGRKSLKLAQGKTPAPADLVVTLKFEDGLAFYLPDERRWVKSYPQHHYQRGVKKERATSNQFKRTIRMFKAARNYLIANGAIKDGEAPSYFIECLLYNVPNNLFEPNLATTYIVCLNWVRSARLESLKCQNGKAPLFGNQGGQWPIERARRYIEATQHLWSAWR